MKPRRDLSGKIIGELTVIKGLELSDPTLGDKEPTLYKTYLCSCSCGKEATMTSKQLGYVKSCGCLLPGNPKENLLGRKFNRLTVIAEHNKIGNGKKKRVAWKCKCDCGNIKIITADSLKSSTIKSCGCLNTESSRKNAINAINKHTLPNPIETVARSVFLQNGYTDGDLSFNDFYILSKLECFYCARKYSCKKIKKFSKFSYLSNLDTDQLTFYYNGLDRIDSNLPHNLNNCVTACFICNRAKSDLGLIKFIEYLYKLISKIRIDPAEYRKLINSDLSIFTDKNKFSVYKSIRSVKKGCYNDIDFSIEKFYQLTQLPCYYCGCEFSNIANRAKHIKKSSQFAKETGNYYYNGLDRLDPSKGHIMTNIIPCCIVCNRSKRSLTFDKFLTWINDIRNNFQNLIKNTSLLRITEFK